MKKKLVFLVVALLTSFGAGATVVDRQQAAQQARDFMAKNFSKSATRSAAQTVNLNSVETGQPLVYAFNVEGGGFVLVAGDDCAPAILGFSETSAIDPTDIPEGMKDLFAQYQLEMETMSRAGVRAAEMENLGPEIQHLMQSEWGQSAPYNYMCPVHDKSNGEGKARSLTGCVATAMAQIMYYHKYPSEISGMPAGYYNAKKKTTYKQFLAGRGLDWDDMLPTYGTRDDVGGTQDQQDAVAKLMRHIGASICMNYSPESSTSWDVAAYMSFVNFFNYDAQTIKFVHRKDYDYTDWCKMIYKELSEKRPVYYGGGSNSDGHAFVVDGYWEADYFRINWGWYGSGKTGAFRLSLCNPNKKYEGGGSGDAGYTSRQAAIIGLQPGKGDQYLAPQMSGSFRWGGDYTYVRKSADEDFNLTESIYQNLFNYSSGQQTFDYGIIVNDAKGEPVQVQLPLNSNTVQRKVSRGRGRFFYSEPMMVGANLPDGDYKMQFFYRIEGEEEWRRPLLEQEVSFKIRGNELTFDSRPDWLSVKMDIEPQTDKKTPHYKVTVTLENQSTDQTFHRSIRLGREDLENRGREEYGFAVTLEPGEKTTVDMSYETDRFVTPRLYLSSLEDGSPLSESTVTGASDTWRPEAGSWEGAFNLSSDLKKQSDGTYVLKTDDSYEVCYTLKNIGKTDLGGYLELVDSIYSASGEYDTEEYAADGGTLSMKPGESGELKLTIHNDDDPDMVHKVSLVSYDENQRPIVYAATEPFVIQPVYDLSMTDITVTPTELIEDEYAASIVNGTQMTVGGKISNPEETAFEGSIVLKRYVFDFGKKYEVDEDGNTIVEADKTYTKEVTIPAGGSIDYSELIDLQGLVQNKDYTVVVSFDINFKRKSATVEVPLISSDTYLVNDATPTGITAVPSVSRQPEGTYDLQGRRVSGTHGKGIYIIDGKKVILK